MSNTVHVKPSGHEFTVEEGESILDAALRQGYAFPYGCRGGACGACKGKVVSGEVDYGDDEPMAVTDEERAVGQALFCIAQAKSDVTIEVKEIGAAEEIEIKKVRTKIHKLERLSEDVMAVYLKLPDAERLQFLAGQYINIVLEDGKRRSFSLANSPHDDQYLQLHIKHIEGGRFTDQLFSGMKENDLLTIEGPHGSFYFREESDRPMIFLATGTGFGPIKAIIEHAFAEGTKRPMYFYWGARHRDGLYLDELARKWADEHENFHYIPVLSQPKREDNWEGRTGYVQKAALEDFDSLGNFEVYACGHPQMVYTAKDDLMTKGLDPEHCFSDAFEWAKD